MCSVQCSAEVAVCEGPTLCGEEVCEVKWEEVKGNYVCR